MHQANGSVNTLIRTILSHVSCGTFNIISNCIAIIIIIMKCLKFICVKKI
jgi:hypothetical protein